MNQVKLIVHLKDCLSLSVLDSFEVHVLLLFRVLALTTFLASQLDKCRSLFTNIFGNILASKSDPSLIPKVLVIRRRIAHIQVLNVVVCAIVINHVFVNIAIFGPGGLSFLVNVSSLIVCGLTTLDTLSILSINDLLFERLDKYVNALLQLLNRSAHEEMVKPAPSVSHKSMLDFLPISVPVFMGQAQKNDVSLLREVLRLLDNIDEHFFNRVLVRCDFLLDQNRGLPLE